MRALGVALAAGLAACATPVQRGVQVAPPPSAREVAGPAEDPTADLTGFLDAAERGDFEEVHARLAAPLRQRYSVERLKADFEAEPLSKERLARARRAMQRTPWIIEGQVARLPLGEGRLLRAVREAGGWKIATLEE